MTLYVDMLGFLNQQGMQPILGAVRPTLNLVHLTSAPPFLSTREEFLEAHRLFVSALELQDDRLGDKSLTIVRNSVDLSAVVKMPAGPIGCILGLQAPPPGVSPHELYELGIRICAIAYDGENAYGGGWRKPRLGLTAPGANFLMACKEAGIIVDVSHAGWKTVEDIMKHHAPWVPNIIASHGGCADVYPHLRNLPDDIPRKIADRGGIVGIAAVTFLLHGRDNSLEPFLLHIKHALNVCGEDAIAIGSDGWHRTVYHDDWKRTTEGLITMLDPDGSMGARWPDQPTVLNRYNRMEIIAEALRDAGISSRVVDKIMGENAIRFLS